MQCMQRRINRLTAEIPKPAELSKRGTLELRAFEFLIIYFLKKKIKPIITRYDVSVFLLIFFNYPLSPK